MDQCHFPEEIARGQGREQTGLAVVNVLGDFRIAIQDHVKTVLDRVFPAQDITRQIGVNLTVGNQFFDLVRFDARKGSGDDLGWCSACGHRIRSLRVQRAEYRLR